MKLGKRKLADGRDVDVGRNFGVRKVCACPRRQQAKCPHPWHFNFTWKGRAYRFSLDRPLAGDMLITHHRDRPGMIGHVGTILGRHDVNIAGMQVGRHYRGGEAIMVLNVDNAIPQEALLEILAIDDVHTAWVVSLPEPEPAWVQEPLQPSVVGASAD